MLDLFKIGIQILNPSILGFFKLIRRVDWGKFCLHALIGGPTSSFFFFPNSKHTRSNGCKRSGSFRQGWLGSFNNQAELEF